MSKTGSKIARLFSKARGLFSQRRDGVYVALIRGDDGRYSEILVTAAKQAGQLPDEIIAPPRAEPGDKLTVFVAEKNGVHQSVPMAANVEGPPPTEPWLWENPSFADEEFFQEFQQILKDQRAKLFPIEDNAE